MLQVDRNRIMNAAANPVRLEMFAQLIALLGEQRKDMVDRLASGRFTKQTQS